MHTNDNSQDDLSSLLYSLENATHFQAVTSIRQSRFLHGVVLFKEKDVVVHINGSRHQMHQAELLFLHADDKKEQTIHFDRALEGYHLQFSALKNQGHGQYKNVSLPLPQSIATSHKLLLQSKAQDIITHQGRTDGWDTVRATTLFQEWVYTLFNEIRTDQSLPLKQLIRDSRDYIHEHYHLDITREHLAQLAGLHIDYYSRKFKQEYQKSPIAYLNDVRLHQAKQWLIQTQEPIRSIAKRVGFSDEFYFSRKFKAKEGCSPVVYVNKIKQSSRVASLNHMVTGHLIALGLEPYAAIMNSSFPIVHQLDKTITIGSQKPDLERLLSAKPDLIVRCAPANQEQTTKDELFNHIAPTLTLSYQDDWRDHLKIIARMVGKEQEAIDVLDRYHTKAEMIKGRIKKKMMNETILILGIGEGAQCVYGQRNLGTVLYGDLHLGVPTGIEDITHLKEVSFEELAAFKADRILLTIYRNKHRLPSKQAIRKQLLQMQQSLEWQSLKAVQHNKVYSIFDSNHLYTSYNSLSHNLFLDKMNQLLVEEVH
ncbi:AraC family transcriptional regulator [Alkalicoccobacillus murimartini]|uniref:ABC-type Fe3+-hydroxamate transport system substrate-binding protein n=1 Tax=Alkalicoccobacillus murimartini TaxID=171685 RepID=A0ABT9YI12_9BACI|nr:AraC family transcriptional regulator [Alkalicoccobacillus murimartini]MDQ0207341.1 ABC-type Fe3+-hydroxamate transport system substrate-binding protein [Alkalicoccobacillus murimartini]